MTFREQKKQINMLTRFHSGGKHLPAIQSLSHIQLCLLRPSQSGVPVLVIKWLPFLGSNSFEFGESEDFTGPNSTPLDLDGSKRANRAEYLANNMLLLLATCCDFG